MSRCWYPLLDLSWGWHPQNLYTASLRGLFVFSWHGNWVWKESVPRGPGITCVAFWLWLRSHIAPFLLQWQAHPELMGTVSMLHSKKSMWDQSYCCGHFENSDLPQIAKMLTLSNAFKRLYKWAYHPWEWYLLVWGFLNVSEHLCSRTNAGKTHSNRVKAIGRGLRPWPCFFP